MEEKAAMDNQLKEITLDLTSFEDKISLHRYLKETMDFPFYYGANLDALHDELTSETQNVSVHVILPVEPKDYMAVYLPKMRRVFEDAAAENYHITVSFEYRGTEANDNASYQ